MLDRIDLLVEVPRLTYKELLDIDHTSQKSKDVRNQVEACRRLQLETRGKLNSALTTTELDVFCKLDRGGSSILNQAMKKVQLSPRGYHRVLRVARTLADLKQESSIGEKSILEALAFRQGR